jgi:hypothetical protein
MEKIMENTPKVEEIEVIPAAEAAPAPLDAASEVPPEVLELKKQLEDEKRARMEAETRAREASKQAFVAKNETEDTQLHLIKSAIDTVKRNNESLRSAYAQAMGGGEYEKASAIQEDIAANAYRLQELDKGRDAMENRPKQPVDINPVEALASQLTPRSAEWVRKHPNCVTDARLYQKMIAAHNMAMADGHTADTDGYFETVEDLMGLRKRAPVDHDVENPMSEAAAPVAPRRSITPPAAPPTRISGSTSSRAVRLTPAEAEAAEFSGLTHEEYFAQKQRVAADSRKMN